MPCKAPLSAWKSKDYLEHFSAATGKTRLVFRKDLGIPGTELEVPCGQCIGCRLDKARAWAVRIMHEVSMHEVSSFLTLTYADDPISLNKRDITLFFKKLRRYLELTDDIKIRYFQVGEYGEQFARPHHHVILFGYDFPDKKPFKKIGQHMQFISPLLADLWPHGLHSIGSVTEDSAMYCAGYCHKKITGVKAKEHYQDRQPEYATMSRRPGLGKPWLDKYMADIFTHDKVVVKSGYICRPPKYYDRLHAELHPDRHEEISAKRRLRAKENPENSDERLLTTHKILWKKHDELTRKYEQQP